MILLAILAQLVAMSAPSGASTFAERIAAAKGGETIAGPTTPADLTLVNRRFAKPVTIRGGNFHAVKLSGVTGLRFVGTTFARTVTESNYRMLYILGGSGIAVEKATFDGGGTKANGINLSDTRDVTITGSRFRGLQNGIQSVRSTDVKVSSSRFENITANSIGMGGASRVTIDGNSFISPVTEREPHPDAIQFWDIAGIPSADITVTNNRMDGNFQAIWITATKGGYDRVTIRGNRANTGYANAISLSGSRDSLVEDNEITTMAGALHMAKLRLERNERLTVRRVKVCKTLERSNAFSVRDVQIGWKCPW